MKMNFPKALFCVALAPLLLATHAVGATILWNPSPTSFNDNPSQVDNTGTFLAGLTIYTSTITIGDSVFTSYLSSHPDITFVTFDAPQQGNGPATTDYEKILSGGSYVADANAPDYGPTLLNLIPTHQYEIQVWAPFWGSSAYGTRFSSTSPAGTANATPQSPTLALGFGGTQPQFDIGTFTADAASQQFFYYGDNGYGVIGAFQVRDITGVPEPTTISLLSLGGLALVLRRRSRLSAAKV